MKPAENHKSEKLGERLATSGFRFTTQRRLVYDVLQQKLDHPTAEEVFIRARRDMPDISHTTVYNCLDALVQCGLLREVRLQRGATRYCANTEDHCHFFCDQCGDVHDVMMPANASFLPRQKGFKVHHYDVAVHGACAACAGRQKK
jgi:Fur family peroxide stress response transcriptional regulator